MRHEDSLMQYAAAAVRVTPPIADDAEAAPQMRHDASQALRLQARSRRMPGYADFVSVFSGI